MIMDYNRVVKDLNGLTPAQFLEDVSKVYHLVSKSETCQKPAHKGQVSLLVDGTWYLLEVKGEYKSTDPVDGLDVAVLQNHILAPVLGIRDPKTDKRIDFVGGIL